MSLAKIESAMKPRHLEIIKKICILLTVLTMLHLFLAPKPKQIGIISPDSDTKTELRNVAHIHTDEPHEILDFEDFDHIQGSPYQIVPNIVHLLFLNKPKIDFYHMVNIFSIYFNHGPDKIYFHCDNCSFSGKYFDALKANTELWKLIEIHSIPFHKTIFGREYGWINYHRSDIWRLQLLMHYGGIFLDNDIYVVQSLKKYLNYEMVVSWDRPFEDRGLGVQVLIAHRNARLLKAHFDQYRVDYKSKDWYYNAGFVPSKILLEFPQLAHVVENQFGTQDLVYELYGAHNQRFPGRQPPNPNWHAWKNFETIHLLIGHRFYMDMHSPIKNFTEHNIWTYDQAYGRMCRSILRRADVFQPVGDKYLKD